jgi:hypothetical protein
MLSSSSRWPHKRRISPLYPTGALERGSLRAVAPPPLPPSPNSDLSSTAIRLNKKLVGRVRIINCEDAFMSRSSVTAITAIFQYRVHLLSCGKGGPTMAQNQQQTILNALKFELNFWDIGGYKPPVLGRRPARASEIDPVSKLPFEVSSRESHQDHSVFRGSPSCLNYGLPVRERPCSECWLITFVPTEKRGEEVPCHHIPLNERGETVATLAGPGNAPHIQEAVLDWLHKTIQQLEAAPAKSRGRAA